VRYERGKARDMKGDREREKVRGKTSLGEERGRKHTKQRRNREKEKKAVIPPMRKTRENKSEDGNNA
jgi:hypothetical protein